MKFPLFRNAIAGFALALTAASLAPASAQDRGYDDGYRAPGGDRPYADGGPTRDGYPVPQGPDSAPPPRTSYKDDAGPPPPQRQGRCLDKYGIQRVLHDQGWHQFDHVEIQGPIAYMTARSDRGEPFDLKLDSCNGSVIEAHPMLAYRDGPPPDYYYPRPTVGFYFGGPGRGYYGHRW